MRRPRSSPSSSTSCNPVSTADEQSSRHVKPLARVPIRTDVIALVTGLCLLAAVVLGLARKVGAQAALLAARDTDELTRLASRRRFSEHLSAAAAGGAPLAVAIVDLDRFKELNDT